MRAVKVIIFVEGSRAHFTSPIIVNITLFRVFFPSKIPLPFLRNRCIPPEGCPHKFVLGFVHHTVKSIRWNMRFGWIESADDIRVVVLFLSCVRPAQQTGLFKILPQGKRILEFKLLFQPLACFTDHPSVDQGADDCAYIDAFKPPESKKQE